MRGEGLWQPRFGERGVGGLPLPQAWRRGAGRSLCPLRMARSHLPGEAHACWWLHSDAGPFLTPALGRQSSHPERAQQGWCFPPVSWMRNPRGRGRSAQGIWPAGRSRSWTPRGLYLQQVVLPVTSGPAPVPGVFGHTGERGDPPAQRAFPGREGGSGLGPAWAPGHVHAPPTACGGPARSRPGGGGLRPNTGALGPDKDRANPFPPQGRPGPLCGPPTRPGLRGWSPGCSGCFLFVDTVQLLRVNLEPGDERASGCVVLSISVWSLSCCVTGRPFLRAPSPSTRHTCADKECQT